jgi:signal transduction histidine kinase
MYSTKDPSFKALLKRNIYFPIVSMLLLLVVLGWLLKATSDQARQVDFTLKTISKANSILSLVVDSETGLRGYSLTQDTRFLDPYLTAQTRLPTEIAQLQRSLAKDPSQIKRLESFQQDLNKWTLVSKPSLKPVDKQVQVSQGLLLKLLVDSMRMRMGQIIQAEQAVLGVHQENQRNSALLLLIALGGSVILIGGSMAYQSFRSITELSERYEKAIAFVEQQTKELRASRDELEARVRERTRDLQAANKELEAFNYSIAHDLRAPLRHISSFAHILEEECGDKLGPEEQRYLKKIFESTSRMDQLINDLLNFSRIGRTELTKQVIDLKKLVHSVIEDHRPEIADRDVIWHVDSLPKVYADPAMLKQVLTNLISNGLKYSSSRDSSEITIGYKEEDDREIIFVRDNGVGFDARYVDKLFGVFQRLHSDHEFEGTGIGLANVKRIINRHGGEVWAEGAIGEGATFSFSLPKVEMPIPKKSFSVR